MHFAADHPSEQVCLPKRPPALEHRREHLQRRLPELVFAGAVRQRMPVNVMANFEIGIVFKRSMRQVERHERQALPIALQQMHSRLHVRDEFVVIDPAVEVGNRTDM